MLKFVPDDYTCDFPGFRALVKILKELKNRLFFQGSDRKTDFRSLIFSEIHAFKKIFFLLRKIRPKKFFFVWDGYVQRDFTIFDFRRGLEEETVFCEIMRD